MLKRSPTAGTLGCKADGKTGIGSRRIFAPQFKLQVLDSYRNDADCKGNQRATARKYGIHRRQIQKWLQVEGNLRNSVLKGINNNNNNNSIITTSANNTIITSNNVVAVSSTTANSNTSVSGVSELIVCPEAVSSRKCGLDVALRSGRQQDDSSTVPVQSSSASATETEIHQHNKQQQPQRNTSGGGEAGVVLECSGEVEEDGGDHLLVDKRVPDIHNNIYHQQQQQPQHLAYEWQHYQMRRSPDTASSTTGSCYSDLGDSSPILVACSDGQCECASSSTSSSSLSELCLPLDYTMHTRTQYRSSASPHAAVHHSPPPPQYRIVTSITSPVPTSSSPLPCECSAVPIDLSVRRQQTAYSIHTPVPVIEPLPPAPLPPAPSPNIWDLSTSRGAVKRAHDQDSTTSSAAASPNSLPSRPVKLFKPYLDHVSDEEDDGKRTQPPVIISSTSYETEYYYNNNNGDYSVLYKEESTPYYSALSSDYYPNGGLQYISSAVAQDLVVHSPFVFNKGNNNHCSGSINSIKQRQSYSLDFKLSAIECYYRDAVCRGNQRAVASKFKIHRRQVQKWLKQEHQLRQRNETMKPMHIVR